MKSSTTNKDAWYYLQGHLRSYLYYTNWWFLPLHVFIPVHILQQMVARLNTIEESECYDKGACKHCGCKVPALTFCDKVCEGNCYPAMMRKNDWLFFRCNKAVFTRGQHWLYIDRKFKLSI